MLLNLSFKIETIYSFKRPQIAILSKIDPSPTQPNIRKPHDP